MDYMTFSHELQDVQNGKTAVRQPLGKGGDQRVQKQLALILVSLLFLVSGCVAPAKRYAIVFGESFAITDEAVQEARNAINNAAIYGSRPIIIGAGAGAAVGVGGLEIPASGKLVNVVVLLEGPVMAPDILSAIGIQVP